MGSSIRHAVPFLALAVLVAAFSFAAPSRRRPRKEAAPRRPAEPAFRRQACLSNRGSAGQVGRPRVEITNERAERRKKPRASRRRVEPPQVAVVTKRPDARVVLVIGDFLGTAWPRA